MQENSTVTPARAQTLTALFKVHCAGFRKKPKEISRADWLKSVFLFNN